MDDTTSPASPQLRIACAIDGDGRPMSHPPDLSAELIAGMERALLAREGAASTRIDRDGDGQTIDLGPKDAPDA